MFAASPGRERRLHPSLDLAVHPKFGRSNLLGGRCKSRIHTHHTVVSRVPALCHQPVGTAECHTAEWQSAERCSVLPIRRARLVAVHCPHRPSASNRARCHAGLADCPRSHHAICNMSIHQRLRVVRCGAAGSSTTWSISTTLPPQRIGCRLSQSEAHAVRSCAAPCTLQRTRWGPWGAAGLVLHCPVSARSSACPMARAR
jgi:hypothetical protein